MRCDREINQDGGYVTRLRATLRISPLIMDNSQSAGCLSDLPEELLRVLGSDYLKSATKWTLTQTRRRYFLNIVVPRQPFKFPAKTEKSHHGSKSKVEATGTGHIPPSTNQGSGLSEKHSGSNAVGYSQPEKNRSPIHSDTCNSPSTVTVKKRKSQSTRKRDRKRWERWQERSKEKGSDLYRFRPVNQNPCSGNSPQNSSTDSALQPDSEPAASPGGDEQDPSSHTDLDTSSQADSDTSSHTDSDTEGCNNLLEEEHRVAPPTLGTQCFCCGKPKPFCPDGLKKCTRCFSAFYCSRVCQGLDWHRHRLICKPPANSASK